MLRELPRGRQPIDTRIVSGEAERARAYEQLREQLRAGPAGVCRVPADRARRERAPSGAGGRHGRRGRAGRRLRAATAELERLREGELKDHRLVLLHGGMRPREKAQAMAQFASGEADVLVATTVIEVGIDVPNATVMLVENAERFGISQLHQLRGRVGRGEHRSRVLAARAPPAGAARLRALAEHADGFELAEIDLRLRKEGELIGDEPVGRSASSGSPACPRTRRCWSARERARRRSWREDPQLQAPEHALLGRCAAAARSAARRYEPIPG